MSSTAPDATSTAQEGVPARPQEARPRPDDRDEAKGLAAVEAELAQQLREEELAEEELPATAAWEGELPETLMRIVDARLTVWQRLEAMERRRGELAAQAAVQEIRDEAARQKRELQKVPSRDALEAALPRVQDKLKNPVMHGPVPPPEARGRQPLPNPHKVYRELLEIGCSQIDLLMRRANLDSGILPTALPAAAHEPLLKLCRRHGVDADQLMSWTYYALGILQRIAQYRSRVDAYDSRLAEARSEDKKRGLMSVLSGSSRLAEVEPLDPGISQALKAAYRELQVIEPYLTNLFWELYEELAWLLVQEQADHDGHALTDDEVATVRAFLRYGLVAVHPGLIKPETLAYILSDCVQDVYPWDNRPQATHVVYADEYILGIAQGQATVSPDEDLELNGRGSALWKADRLWRLAVIGRLRTQLIEAKHQELLATIEQQQQWADVKTEEVNQLKANPRKKQQAVVAAQELVGMRAQISRLAHAAEHISTHVIPKVRVQADDACHRIYLEAKALTRELLVRREARFVRRVARLAARLKEPFPPFVLRDHFAPGRNDHHARQVVRDAIHKLEEADGRVFHHVLVSDKRRDRQTAVRMSPVFLLTPCRGPMGFSFCERKWDDNGRLVLPLLAQRQGMLETLLVDMLADFRWDCSKESAGMDWITADALCSAYAAVRWSCRKLPEKSQKMMGLDPKLRDKANWRLHYRLFVKSAAEQGRLLFTKCDDVYRLVLQYIGLPPGVEPLKRD